MPPPQRDIGGASSVEEDYESAAEVDPDVIAESLLACLIKHDALMEAFRELVQNAQSARQNSCPGSKIVKKLLQLRMV